MDEINDNALSKEIDEAMRRTRVIFDFLTQCKHNLCYLSDLQEYWVTSKTSQS